MVAVDILIVSLSTNNNRYLLVLQDYFTRWADAVPLPDQMAGCIVTALIKFFCTYDPPQLLHSDQCWNFESTILTQVLQAIGIRKSRTTSYHPQGDGMVEHFNRTLLQLLRAYCMLYLKVTEKPTYFKCYTPIAQQYRSFSILTTVWKRSTCTARDLQACLRFSFLHCCSNTG